MLLHAAVGRFWRVDPSARPAATPDAVPEPIRRIFDEAKLCRSVDANNAAAVMARRALEMACKGKGAKHGKLVGMIKELAAEGAITAKLARAADAIRLVGNEGAHADDELVDPADVDDVIRLTDRFLEVLYVDEAVADELLRERGR